MLGGGLSCFVTLAVQVVLAERPAEEGQIVDVVTTAAAVVAARLLGFVVGLKLVVGLVVAAAADLVVAVPSFAVGFAVVPLFAAGLVVKV